MSKVNTVSECGVVGRLAPSPTGRLHAGNVFAALCAWLLAKIQNGRIVLRIENLDAQRSRPSYIDAVQYDFEALGLTWDVGPFFQHDRFEAYQCAFELLHDKGLVYPCFCTRADLHAASAPHAGEKLVYLGTCRSLSANEVQKRMHQGQLAAQRVLVPALDISFSDALLGYFTQNLQRDCGDFIIQRSNGAFAYQLAVVVDDAAQGITSVVRGSDLLSSTPQQIYLQSLLGLSQPQYAHIPLVMSPDGRRLSKRNKDAALDALLERFKTPAGVIGYLAGISGITPSTEAIMPEEILKHLNIQTLIKALSSRPQIVWRSEPTERTIKPR